MKSLEIFSGVGGLALGLHSAGFNHLDFLENDQECCKTLSGNFSPILNFDNRPPIRSVDVKAFNFSAYQGRVALLAGGPPCQPFSFGGNHLALLDHRDMFPEAIRAVRESAPR